MNRSVFVKRVTTGLAMLSLLASGCAQLRLPAIDPSGRRIFLPNPAYTTVLPRHDGGLFNHGLFNRNPTPSFAPPNTSFLQQLHSRPQWGHAGLASLSDRIHGGLSNCRLCDCVSRWNANRPRLLDLFRGHGHGCGNDCVHGQQFARGRLCPKPLFRDPPQPPSCNADGTAPLNGPCYPVGTGALPPDPPTNRVSCRCGNCLAQPRCTEGSIPGPGCEDSSSSTSMAAGIQVPGVVINPRRLVAAVGQEVVLVGGIWHPDGDWMVDEPVEWLLSQDSVGTIVDGGLSQQRPGFLGRLLHKKPMASGCRGCNDYLAVRTSPACAVLQRGTPNPADDVYLKRGQSWVSLTSGSEGPSYVTLMAPQVPNWSARQQTATIYWVDGQWAFPPPANGSISSPVDLSTFVVRQSDGSPIDNWIVRYQILDGPAAGLNAAGAQVVDVPTDAQGRAPLQVYPRANENGTTRIGVEIIKPRTHPAEPPQLVVGQGQTFINWGDGTVVPAPAPPPGYFPPTTGQPPARIPPPFAGDNANTAPPANSNVPDERTSLDVRITGPTELSANAPTVGYRVEVVNTGRVAAENVRITNLVPNELKYLKSTPPGAYLATGGPKRVEWVLDALPAGKRETYDIEYQPIGENRINNVVLAEGQNATRDSDSAPTVITRPALRVTVSNPNPPTAQVGQPVNFVLTVENLGNQPLTEVQLTDQLEIGLDHPNQSRAKRVGMDMKTIAPGDRQTVELTLVPNQPGTSCHDVTVESKEGARDSARGCVEVIETERPSLIVDLRGPAQITAGETAEFVLSLENDGNVDLQNLQIVYDYQPELRVESAPDRMQSQRNRLVWNENPFIAGSPINLPRGQFLTWRFIVVGDRPIGNACNRVTVVGRGDFQRSDDQCVEVVAPANVAPPNRANPNPNLPGADAGFDNAPPRSGRPPNITPNAAPGARRGLTLGVEYLGLDASRTLLEYDVALTNTSDAPYRDVQVQVSVAPDMQITGIVGDAAQVAQRSADSTAVQLAPIATVRANETVHFVVQVRPSPATTRAILRATAAGPDLRRALQAQAEAVANPAAVK